MKARSYIRRIAVIRKARRFAMRVLGVDPWLRRDVHMPMELIGSDYGGWYVAPGLIPSSPLVLSLGIGTDVTFDRIMIARFGATVIACDPTPIAVQTIAKAGLQPPAFTFLPIAVSDFDGRGTFEPVLARGEPSGCFRLCRESAGSYSRVAVDVKSIVSVVGEHCKGKVDVAKVDIEGSEYEVLPALLEAGIRPGQVLVEFHHRFADRGLKATRAAVEVLRGAGYRLAMLSDQGPEYSFVHESFAGGQVGVRPRSAERSSPAL